MARAKLGKTDPNRTLACAVLAVTVLAAVGGAIALFQAPGSLFATINTFPVKGALLLGGEIFLLHLGWSVFRTLWKPPASTMCLRGINLITFLGILTTVGPPGFLAVDRLYFKFQLSTGSPQSDEHSAQEAQTGLQGKGEAKATLTFDAKLATQGAVGGFAVTGVLLLGFIPMYHWLLYRESERKLGMQLS